MYNNYFYNKNIKTFARKLRNNSTYAEIKIWKELLRAGKMMGFQFNRQRPVGKYVADFMCKELKLIIEIDGFTHNFKHEYDKARESELKNMSFSILRFTDEEVVYDIDNVAIVIENWVEKNSSPRPPSPAHKLTHKGEGITFKI